MTSIKIRSPIWQYFIICSDNNKYAICSLCGVKISRGGEGKKAGTSAMNNHLKTKHPEKSKAIMKDKAEKYKVPTPLVIDVPDTSSTYETMHKSPSPESVLQIFWNENDSNDKKIDYMIAEMIALDNEPFCAVENIGFTRLLKQILPRYEIPSSTFIVQNIVPDIHLRIYEKIKRNMASASAVSVTSDIWISSHNNATFLSFTGHWLSPEFQMQHGVLAMKPVVSQTGLNTVEELNTTATLWDIEESKIHLLIHNSDDNIIKGVPVAEYDYDTCFIHDLQKVVTESLKAQSEVIEVIITCRQLVAHVNNFASKLLTIQKKLSLPEQQLVQDISTRWNSTFYMIERILEQKCAISVYVANHETAANFTFQQWCLMEQFIQLLKPFEEITKTTTSGFSCISEVIPIVATLKKYLDKDETEQRTNDLVYIRVSLKTNLDRYFKYLTQNSNYLIATFLDPRFKTRYLGDIEAERVQQKILLDCIKMSRDKCCDSLDPSTSTHAKKNKTDKARSTITCESQETFCDYFDDQHQTKKEIIASEIDYYLNTVRIDHGCDPYIWWSANIIQYPNLSKLARIYLSSPCSSVNREIHFSEPGLIYENKRNQLSSNAEELVLINRNLPLVNFEY